MLIRLLFFEKLQFPQVDLRILFFPLFFWESSAGEFWSSNPNKLLHVRQFAASNQCNRSTPDLLENTTVKLGSNWGQCLCGDWWISILDLCQFLWVCGLSILAVILIKGNEKRNLKRQEREANTIKHNRQHLIIESRYNLTVGLFILWVDYRINKRNHFSINEFISLLATGTLDLV